MSEVILVDNYDSFTWNLYQYLSLLGAQVTVYRSQDLTLEELLEKHPSPSHVVISPGPGHPLRDSGISIPVIKHFAGKVPILGVCMGLQCIYATYGGNVDGAGEIIHGKTSGVNHDGKGIFKGVTQEIQSTRYHSLAGNLSSLPEELEVTSRTKEGVQGEKGGIVMGIRHKTYAVEAVQYHPESILSEEGKVLLANFLALKGGLWSDNPTAEVNQPNGLETKDTSSTQASSSKLPTILDNIYAQRTQDVALSKATPGSRQQDIDSLLALHVSPPLVSLYDRLRSSSSTSKVALMAEYKRASPSKGDIMPPDSPISAAAVGLAYALAGASVISVLTEPKRFKGSLSDMRAVRDAIDSLPNRPAVLRKDFILDTYQIDEARINGADTVLLIVAMLDQTRLQMLYDFSMSRGMEPLVEVNNSEELERALAIGSRVIGVNNRNLHDFKVDMNTTSRIADVIREKRGAQGAEEVVLCALSGISNSSDVSRYVSQGVGAVLVGEALMRASDKPAFVRQLLNISSPSTSASSQVKVSPPDGISSDNITQPLNLSKKKTYTSSPTSSVMVKICGLKTPEDALAAADAGADFVGLMFVAKSKRYVTKEEARSIIQAVRSRDQQEAQDHQPIDMSSDWFAFQTSRLQRKRKPMLVGVFQNPKLEDLIELVDDLQLDAVQFHGSESIHWASLLQVPVIKAFHIEETASVELDQSVKEASRPGYHSIALLDTKVGSGKDALSGGAGVAFDWSIANQIAEARLSSGLPRLPIMLAGGLTPENVSQAVEQVKPWAIDVSGGVETEGKKDVEKIRNFIRAAKGLSA